MGGLQATQGGACQALQPPLGASSRRAAPRPPSSPTAATLAACMMCIGCGRGCPGLECQGALHRMRVCAETFRREIAPARKAPRPVPLSFRCLWTLAPLARAGPKLQMTVAFQCDPLALPPPARRALAAASLAHMCARAQAQTNPRNTCARALTAPHALGDTAVTWP